MSNSIKSMIFCLVGLIVFSVASFFLSPLLLIGLIFSLGALISFDVFLFQKITTKYFWIKISGLSLINIIYTIASYAIYNSLSANNATILSIQYCRYFFYLFTFLFASTLIISLFDFFITKVMHMSKNEVTPSNKWFRFSFIGIFIFYAASIIVPYSNLVPLFILCSIIFQVINIIDSIIIICSKTTSKRIYKSLVSSFSVFCSLIIFFFSLSKCDSIKNNILSEYYFIWYYSLTCLISLLVVFFISIIMILINSFSKVEGIKGSLVAILISIISAIFSYLLIDGYSVVKFIPSIPYINYIFTALFAFFILSITFGIMKIAYSLIFKSTPTTKVETINIDDNFVEPNESQSISESDILSDDDSSK